MVKRLKNPQKYGLWESVIQKEMVVSKALRFGSLQSDGHYIYWCEVRSEEKGRGVIMRWCEEDGISEVLPAPFSARSKVHEYGGGEFCLADGKIFFVNEADQQIYWVTPGNTPTKITNAPAFRFADMTYDNARDRLIAVAEKHDLKMDEHDFGGQDLGGHSLDAHDLPENMLVNIGLSGAELGGVSIMEDTHDFYSSPTISPDHTSLAWLQWDLPSMPWEAAELMISSLNEPRLEPVHVSGGLARGEEGTEETGCACFQPVWDKSNVLYFISDHADNGLLYSFKDSCVQLVDHQTKEADSLRPQWVFGMGAYALSPSKEIVLSSYLNGECHLQYLNDVGGAEADVKLLSTKATSIETPLFCGQYLTALITTDENSQSVGLIDIATGDVEIIRQGSAFTLKGDDNFKDHISKGELKQFHGASGDVYGLYYPPFHGSICGEEGTLPPAIITVHGGPTAMADRGVKMKTQYWTNRGFAVFDVDYAGSSGYGKAYRERLTGKWGVADVEDIVSAALYLISEKLVDPEKLIVSGGSAGGYTCLMALVESDLFKCASCNYPVTDLGQLLEITHKFEHGYTYRLTGTDKGNAIEQLGSRSVLSNVEKINAPVIFFQGLEDKVVPPSQPEAVYEALDDRGVFTKIIHFENEGHGFRRAETIMNVLREEENFYQKVLNLAE